MKPDRDVLGESVRAFRYVTSQPGHGRATRARVLAAAERRRSLVRRARLVALSTIAALVVVVSGAGAYTAIGRWRTAVSARRPEPAATRVAVRVPTGGASNFAAPAPSGEPAPVAAPARVSPSAPDRSGEEERAYGHAHRLHFGGEDPRAALAAWNAYLGAYPRGSFVPEARYNRALLLMRLGRDEAAIEALRPFAAGAFGAYRRDEASLLIEAVAGRRR